MAKKLDLSQLEVKSFKTTDKVVLGGDGGRRTVDFFATICSPVDCDVR